MNTEKIGAYLASLRKGQNMTQQEAAERLGVSNKTVSKWESGAGLPDIGALPAIAALYGVTADDILAGETRPRQGVVNGEVTAYLERRGELRYRIGYGVSLLATVASVVLGGYNWSILLLFGGGLALWIGWSRCSGETLRVRLLGLIPVAALWLMVLARDRLSWSWIYELLPDAVTQRAWAWMTARDELLRLLLLAALLVMYMAGSIIAKRPLLRHKVQRWTALAAWALLLAAEVLRVVVCWDEAVAYATTSTIFIGGDSTVLGQRGIALQDANAPFVWLRWGLLIVGIGALVWVTLREKKKENTAATGNT